MSYIYCLLGDSALFDNRTKITLETVKRNGDMDTYISIHVYITLELIAKAHRDRHTNNNILWQETEMEKREISQSEIRHRGMIVISVFRIGNEG